MSFVIGIDGGGSHTRAVILDERGSEVGRAEATGEVVTERAPGLAADAVAAAARPAARGAGLALPGAVLWAGLAGAGSEAARRAVAREIEAAGLAGRVRVGTDVEAAFHAAFPEGPGVLLIAGTGSIAWGRSPSGASVRVGGWGRLLGDEGSAFALGMGALRAVARAEDGRAAATTLREGVLGTLGIEAAGALIAWAAGASKAEVAALAAVVTRAAAA
ncbi:MAG TPA: BadF/BadG/BcrA/BcrD ATPase family protein, partial [Longimicrobiales bacterium]|nr:BadF/BadG/BcrA/BcrD ATPase family protein [Longimicrobiales bacterium]